MARLFSLIALTGMLVSCAHFSECREMKKYLWKDEKCASGYSVPYMAGPATCMSKEEVTKLKEYCPFMF